ncbi:hypothetical protein Tco_1577120 [Tanacetum coccineum]
MTQAQQRKYMCTYLKNMAGWKPTQLRAFGDEEIIQMFNSVVNKINAFVDFRQELVEGTSKKAEQKVADEEDTAELQANKEETVELQQMIQIVPDEEGIRIDDLNVKYPIIDWEIYKEGKREDDLQDLWRLVKDRYSSTKPTKDMDRMLWTDLKRMFEPNPEDEVWRHQHNSRVLHWILYDSCRVYYLVMNHMMVYMLVENKYPLSQATLTMMLKEKLIVDHECEMAYELLRFIRRFWRHLDDLEKIWKLFRSFGGNSEKAGARTHVFLNKYQDMHTGDIDTIGITTRCRLKNCDGVKRGDRRKP